MFTNQISPQKSLNKAFLKFKINNNDLEKFTHNLTALLNNINNQESEEFHKNLLIKFFNNTYYQPEFFINTKDRNDLVIHNGKNATNSVGVILEIKKPSNKTEMLTTENLNKKALQELLLYYLRERITQNNLELKHLIVTNIYQWFIFDAQLFDKLFAQNKQLVQQFIDFENGTLAINTTDLFYQEIAKKAIENVNNDLSFTYFDLTPKTVDDESDLITLYKIFSPEHLLKLPFLNDSNSLDRNFYHELLYIIGLTEVKQGSKKLIQREKTNNRNKGSLIENAITQIKSLGKIYNLKNIQEYGETEEEQLFNLSLELVITWVNRILFLKLLESQLINYNCRDVIYNVSTYSFLNLDKIRNYGELNSLFFRVLAIKNNERDDDIKDIFDYIPYLNSSLFEVSDLENQTIVISNLTEEKIPLFSQTILKDRNGKKRTGKINSLEYLFEFLNSYDFGDQPYVETLHATSLQSTQIKEDNKTLINAAVLGLIFEKINGYQDGSFFTPSFITMYMCRETIRRAILQKFNEIKGWNCENLSQLYDKITDKKEANSIINNIKICDPAVGSGHFLVSALNEIIAIKSELKILLDREGKTLRDYEIEVVNDELIITDDDGNLYKYNPNNRESQRIQETLFHEKQTIIENCLFGVDINKNSVKICRLRLWIELLKNAYYNVIQSDSEESQHWRDASLRQHDKRELQTLPNIDINIKCGNSLISKFQLDLDLKKVLKQIQSNIESYKNAVKLYKNATNKQEKRELVKLINNLKWTFRDTLVESNPKKAKLRKLEGELYNLENQISLFEETKTEKKTREKQINKLNKEIDKLKNELEEIETGIIYQKAFEWRFEFPEVLDEEGNFIGFDIVIGNPPYGVKLTKIEQEFFTKNYEFSTSETAILFIKKGWDILTKKGLQSYIIPKSYTFASNYAKIRDFTINNLTELVDCGKVWQDVKLEVCIFRLNKAETTQFYLSNKLVNNQIIQQTIIDKKLVNIFDFFLNGLTNEEINLGLKIKQNCQTLNDISSNQRGAMIQKLLSEKGDRLVIGGAEVQKYGITGIKGKVFSRDINDQKAFIKPNSILVQRIVAHIENPVPHIQITATIPDNNKYILVDTINQITLNKGYSPEFIWGILHSKLINWYVYRFIFSKAIRTMQFDNPTTSKIPIANNITSKISEKITNLVEKIMTLKKDNSHTNTSELEREIDLLVYELYGLTEEEIAIIEND